MLLTTGYVTDVLMCNITSAQEISDQVKGICFVDAAVVSANFNIITCKTHINNSQWQDVEKELLRYGKWELDHVLEQLHVQKVARCCNPPVGLVLAMSSAFGNRMLKPFVVAEPEIQEQKIERKPGTKPRPGKA